MPSILVLLLLCLGAALQAAGTTVLFRPGAPDTGPFPTDFLTVEDRRQVTGVRVNLPLPDCASQPSSCQEIALLNQLDGFSLQPRIAVRFSAPVNTSTLRDGIFLVWLDNPANEQPGAKPGGSISCINEVVYEPATNTAFAESDDMLDQHRVYALVVTDDVRDGAGDAVEPDPAFVSCVGQAPPNAYCGRLAEELKTIPEAGRAVAASLFTTMAATSYLEKARAALELAPLDFRRTGARSVFDVGEILAIILRQPAGVNPPRFEDFVVPLPSIALEQVGRIAFGSYRSPHFLNASQIVPTEPNRDPVVLPAESKDVYFHAFLPESHRPQAGYPAIIFGHGLNDSRFGAPTLVAGSFAEHGFATIAINAAGHGLGSAGTLRIIDNSFRVTELPAAGRGVDIDGDGQLTSREGCLVLTPAPVGLRDCVRQTVLDLLQLVRLIRTGVDLDGDGAIDLDPNRIYLCGAVAWRDLWHGAACPCSRSSRGRLQCGRRYGCGHRTDKPVVPLYRPRFSSGPKSPVIECRRRFRRQFSAQGPAGQAEPSGRRDGDSGGPRTAGVVPDERRPAGVCTAYRRVAVSGSIGEACIMAIRAQRPDSAEPRNQQPDSCGGDALEHRLLPP